ncbi:MAG: hypothetical protein H7235_03015 [Bdellovibrionaceae bacterium]|nr:hypothetical protein [Pseudobdellovibrionaceae bacterium]
MKDFLKIFLVLCALVSAFFYGRNYGEDSKVESSEFKNLKSDHFNNKNAQEEIVNLKEKFQKLLDSSDLKKSDEILGKIMTIFLADLNLQLTADQQKDIEIGKRVCVIKPPEPVVTLKAEITSEIKSDPKHVDEEPVIEAKKSGIKNEGKFKAAELEIAESDNIDSISKALAKVELKKIDSLLDGAAPSTFQQSKKFFGDYRGSIIDVTGKVYGSVIIEIKNTPGDKDPIKGKIQLLREGKPFSTSTFASTELGYTPENFQATVVQMGSTNYLQLYKSESAQKIAGIFYERLVNGTTKTIGHFILSRTDFAD